MRCSTGGTCVACFGRTVARLTSLSRSVDGHVALVTGAGSGIGRSTAHLLADEGVWVAVTDISAGKALAVADEIIDTGGNSRAWELDVSDAGAVGAVVDEVAGWGGRLDILVNNAGMAAGGFIDDEGFEDSWHRAIEVMLTAQTLMIRACLSSLRESPAARIVNVSSTEGVGGSAGMSPYTVAKHGVLGLTRSLAVELGDAGITVNAVCPGPINTDLTSPIPDDAKARFARRRTAVGRYGEPEEVAHAIVHLTLPASSYITGHALMVDGGMSVRNN
ncbi:MAG: 3-oxoacyl-ACP reductase [Acidimicrobiaceae bacterium]|nr:3-oxoacyl-ACP reductase [Acidimicrobiaceae bacterium]